MQVKMDGYGREGGQTDSLEKHAKMSQVYLAIISRYREYIEEKENISVAELPTLVTPKAELVVRLAGSIKSELEPYTYDRHFPEAAAKAVEFVRTRIDDIKLPLEFWLSPEDTIKFGMGDVIDKNILLCSVLVALGNPSSKVLVVIDGTMRSYNYFEFNGRHLLIDFPTGIKGFPTREAMLSSLSTNEDSTVYEFNNQRYEDLF
ncbi:MAG TPA: hypothetical protein VND15_04465 [Candidatus Acidoferrales bacterium]|nr:hypothetical protein [Candidatus Acidoferrales bacterium]